MFSTFFCHVCPWHRVLNTLRSHSIELLRFFSSTKMAEFSLARVITRPARHIKSDNYSIKHLRRVWILMTLNKKTFKHNKQIIENRPKIIFKAQSETRFNEYCSLFLKCCVSTLKLIPISSSLIILRYILCGFLR